MRRARGNTVAMRRVFRCAAAIVVSPENSMKALNPTPAFLFRRVVAISNNVPISEA
jgi:hypothetical protein